MKMLGGSPASDRWRIARHAVAAYKACLAAGEPFEAHEALEVAWRDPEGPLGQDAVARALIQVAAAYVHLSRGHPDGARRLRSRARERLLSAVESGLDESGRARTVTRWERLGVDLPRVLGALRTWPEDPRAWPGPGHIPGLDDGEGSQAEADPGGCA